MSESKKPRIEIFPFLDSSVDEALTRFEQRQVLKYVHTLDDEQQKSLAEQLKNIDFEVVTAAYQSVMALEQKAAEQDSVEITLQPIRKIAKAADATPEERQAWWDTGLNAIAKGKVGAIILSGGQGTRLGYDGPKGTYDISLPSKKSLFQLFSERVIRLKQLARQKLEIDTPEDVSPQSALPLYIMTSPLNDQTIRDFFSSNNYFGLPEAEVIFFCQGTLPCLTLEGKIIMESSGVIAQAPAGNGDIYPALRDSGALADMEMRQLEYLHVFSVDNAICKVADPIFIGYCIQQEADCGNKVVWKSNVQEKVGVCVEKNGKPAIVEYSEMPSELNNMVDDSGRPVYGGGNICNHFFTLSFIKNTVLPNQSSFYHMAKKKIPFADENGQTVTPTETNGMKLEAFIFDVFPMSSKFVLLEVDRAEEFTPVKNAPGAASDTPESAREKILAQGGKWLSQAGARFPNNDSSLNLCEVSPLQSYSGEELEQYKDQVISTEVLPVPP